LLYYTISKSQELRNILARWFCLRLSYEVIAMMPARDEVSSATLTGRYIFDSISEVAHHYFFHIVFVQEEEN
jgi:hypothetical protein